MESHNSVGRRCDHENLNREASHRAGFPQAHCLGESKSRMRAQSQDLRRLEDAPSVGAKLIGALSLPCSEKTP
jgi:hypothetical protein